MFYFEYVTLEKIIGRGVEANSFEEAQELLKQMEYDEYDPLEPVSTEYRVYQSADDFFEGTGDYEII